MARPHIESIDAYGVAPVVLGEGLFAGARSRLLSADDSDGSSTALVTCPAGWRGELGGSRAVELLLLTGAGSLGGRALRPGTWAWVPAGAVGGELVLAAESDVLVMVESERSAGGEVEVIDTVEAVFEEVSVATEVTGVPPGLSIKSLRVDAETRDRSWIAGAVPGWLGYRAEIHPTVEEALLLRGDCLLGNSGTMRAGDYFWRPGGIYHGPFATREGMLYFFRTKGGDLAVEWFDPPGWEKQARAYYDQTPFFAAGVGGA